MIQEISENREGKLLKIGYVPGHHGGIATSDPDFIQYHLRPSNPNEPLKGATFEDGSIVIINDDVDISGYNIGDVVRCTQKPMRCSKVGSSHHWDYKELPVITHVERVQ